ncbi:YncE family protein [Roseisolibacter agri]|uniref:YncE family protein n=1 Tax=Roseisolibacter agri TaxID=2014610 RepID=A0AA37VBZ6_9BACT|nr:YncE family protein [Roseisolibacter agri]GLC27103.1 hypothetical protein rosag_36160 [Roseisolibacter agri]
MTRLATAAALLLAATPLRAQQPAQAAPPTRDYRVFVGSEGDDRIQLVRFGPAGATVERQFRVGTNPTELLGPHGVGVAPDGRHYFVSTAHGTPNGALLKYTTAGDSLAGRVTLGAFPATLQVSPDGNWVYVVNFNLHGDMVPSSVSVVYAPDMAEVARIPTCTMPHGSRLSPDGTRHYSACMMDDALVEIDARNLKVARWFSLAKGAERGMTGAPPRRTAAGGVASGHDMTSHTDHAGAPAPVACSPTWAQPSPDGKRVWVACNKSNDLVEIDVASWTMTRRIPTGEGTYNLAVTRDGTLLVGTNKRGQSVSLIDVASGRELARIPTARRVPSGVALSPDDRYAFVTVEGIGAQPGTVEIIDLRARQAVARVDVGPQAGGIDVWTQPAVR